MKKEQPTKVKRDCHATVIPSGEKVTLHAGDVVWVTQALGGGFTVMTERGSMVHISGGEADALGLAPVASRPALAAEAAGDVEERVWDQLRACFDPEIPINIVDLGLVYDCRVAPLQRGGSRVQVRFTLTARGCGMGEVLKEGIRNKIAGVPGVAEVDVELVWDPPWDQSKISQEGKVQLGIV
ncbi:MAG: putative Fe-S cluster assembly protein SufT [Deltaproteobacteria bacterium]|nr:putative Fe-S cluster assembly protein SufT [Deltaproteobacteria bacterium]